MGSDDSRICSTSGEAPDKVRAEQTEQTGQHKSYLILCDEERAKGFVKPYRDRYKHLTCGTVTTMSRKIAETYARDPWFYASTFCVHCNVHRPLAEFAWEPDGEPMDPREPDNFRARRSEPTTTGVTGVELIAAERARQICEEGWTPEHDDGHKAGELAAAAACYAWPEPRPLSVKKAWPWERHWWKPLPSALAGKEGRIRELTKAGALIAAEIDRLQRCEAPDA